MSGAEPRVNSRTLSKHVGGTVRLTAKVLQISGDQATVEASDGGQDTHIEDPYVEIIGNVQDDHTVKALTFINMGKNLNMKAVDTVVGLTHSAKGEGVFYAKPGGGGGGDAY